VAITYDAEDNIDRVLLYDASEDEYTILTLDNFDIFTLTAAAGDAMAFALGASSWGCQWHDVYLHISTALNAVMTLKWQYWHSDLTWHDIPAGGITDGTNGLTQSGWVTFPIPDYFVSRAFMVGAAVVWGYQLRVVINTFTSITAVGHVDQTPKCKNGILKVTGTNDIEDLYDASVAGSWGVVSKDENNYVITANLQVGDGSTETLLEILDSTVLVGTDSKYRTMWTSTNSSLQLGEKNVDGDFLNGSVLRYNSGLVASYPVVYWRGAINLYSSIFEKKAIGARDAWFSSLSLDLENSIFIWTGLLPIYSTCTGNVKNTVIEASRLDFHTGNVTMDGVLFNNKAMEMWGYGGPIVENVDFSEQTGKVCANNCITTFLNCKFDSFADQIEVYYNGTVDVEVTLDLNIVDKNNNVISGLAIQIRDKNDNIVYDDDGVDAFDMLIYKRVEVSNVPTITEYNPFTITVSKKGYKTYRAVFSLTQKTNWTIQLEHSPYATIVGVS